MEEENEEKKQLSDTEIDRLMDEYTLANAEVSLTSKRYDSACEKRDEQRRKFYDSNFEDKMLEKFKEIHDSNYDELVQLRSKFDKMRGNDVQSEIRKVFKVVFEEARSKNHEICVMPEKSWTVTFGKKGFARRDNVQAQEMNEYDFKLLMENADFVAKKMRENGFDKFAKKLLKFKEHMPNMDYEDMYVLEYTDHTLLQSNHGTMKVEHIGFDSSALRLIENFEYEEGEGEDVRIVRNGYDTEYLRITQRYGGGLTFETAVAMYHTGDHLKNAIKEFKALYTEKVEEIQEQINTLKRAFGKELLMENL